MKYGPLGRSGLIVSRICLGGNSWGAKGRRGWGKFDETEAPAYFKRALDVGITFFDTADTYNFGRSEEIMGATLLKMAQREDIVDLDQGRHPHEHGPQRCRHRPQAPDGLGR